MPMKHGAATAAVLAYWVPLVSYPLITTSHARPTSHATPSCLCLAHGGLLQEGVVQAGLCSRPAPPLAVEHGRQQAPPGAPVGVQKCHGARPALVSLAEVARALDVQPERAFQQPAARSDSCSSCLPCMACYISPPKRRTIFSVLRQCHWKYLHASSETFANKMFSRCRHQQGNQPSAVSLKVASVVQHGYRPGPQPSSAPHRCREGKVMEPDAQKGFRVWGHRVSRRTAAGRARRWSPARRRG